MSRRGWNSEQHVFTTRRRQAFIQKITTVTVTVFPGLRVTASTQVLRRRLVSTQVLLTFTKLVHQRIRGTNIVTPGPRPRPPTRSTLHHLTLPRRYLQQTPLRTRTPDLLIQDIPHRNPARYPIPRERDNIHQPANRLPDHVQLGL